MPATIQLHTTPGVLELSDACTSMTIDLFGPSLARCEFEVNRAEEIAPQVKAFGDMVRKDHPDASSYVSVRVKRGSRKPRGFDAADKAGDFGESAFMHVVDKRSNPTPAAPSRTGTAEMPA